MKSRIVVTALVIALFASLLLLVNAGRATAAPAAAGGKQQVSPQTRSLKFVGKRNFAPSPKAPAKNGPDLSRANPNRPIPSKKAQSPRAPGVDVLIPTVKPTTVANNTPGLQSAAKGLNAYDSFQAEGIVFQPPDQGLCAGNGYVLEGVNDVYAVYDAQLNKLTGNMALADFFGLDAFALEPEGDPKCYFDPGTGRFFATIIALDPAGAPGFYIAINVSATNDPRLGWYNYVLETTNDCPVDMQPCLPDQPLLGANRDAIFISTNEYSWFGTGAGFSGTNVYVLDKTPMVGGGFFVNVALLEIGAQLATPDNVCCWYTVQPAFSGRVQDWDNRQGGIEYFLSSLEFFGTGDNRIALWALTNTQSIHALPTSWIFTLNLDVVSSEVYETPLAFSQQKDDGLIPLGRTAFGATQAGPIQPNDDRMNQVFFANRTLWSGLNTALYQNLGRSTMPEYHNGIAYFGIQPRWDADGNLTHNWLTQGYVSPIHEDVIFPSIAVDSRNRGAMVFSLTSPTRYPSAAYTAMGPGGAGKVFVSNPGMSSYDGSCEYNPACGDSFGSGLRPRWGDYSAAVVMNNKIYMATEYIQYRDCDVDRYLVDPSCGDTRAPRQNWGTSIAIYK